MKKVLIIGAGLGGLATALRLATRGFEVKIVEKDAQPGGRLNRLERDGFTFDLGPSFYSMSYEFDSLFADCGMENPLRLEKLDPIYKVFFRGKSKPYRIFTDLSRLAKEFQHIEPDFESRARAYLHRAKAVFDDTEYRIVKHNFKGLADYFLAMASVPKKYIPLLLKSMWKNLENHFQSHEVKVVFSLVAFFLGATPFNTPAIYSLLNHTELQHDGYWNVKGGMYAIVEEIVAVLRAKGVEIQYDTEISQAVIRAGKLAGFTDTAGNTHQADVYVCNADAAWFRGGILKRPKFAAAKLDRMQWTLAPFTIYLGIKGKLNDLQHHNYFLGNDFTDYADKIFTRTDSPKKPYYYVNVNSKCNANCAPPGCENLFILCPVPDLRFKTTWEDKENFANRIITDLSGRIGYDLTGNTLTRCVYTPIDWEKRFNLYRGSGLGLAHGFRQVGGFRPSNRDEQFKNLYYVGASTVPGTGLPIVVIGSGLVVQRILEEV